MKAIQIVAPKKVEMVAVPVPGLAENEALIKVECCVTCPHWDITLYKGIDIFERPGRPKYPIPWGYPGHEMAGQVVEIGAGVKTLKKGDRVATLCTAGETVPGFYCEYINRPENTIVKIPDEISYEAGANMEMCRYMVPYIRLLGLSNILGQRIGITGVGPAGLIALQMLKSLGAAEVVAIDILEERLKLAKKLGATDTVNSATDEIQKLKNKPLNAALDCSGISAGLQVALDYTHGTIAMFAVPHGNTVFTTRHWGRNLLTKNAGGPFAEDTNFVLALWQRKQLDTDALVTVKLPFDRYAEGVEMLMARKAIKVGFYPS